MLTHLHFDHVGSIDAFPDVTILLQRYNYEYERWKHALKTVVAALLVADGAGTPFGITVFCGPGGDAKLLAIGGAIEHALDRRQIPAL